MGAVSGFQMAVALCPVAVALLLLLGGFVNGLHDLANLAGCRSSCVPGQQATLVGGSPFWGLRRWGLPWRLAVRGRRPSDNKVSRGMAAVAACSAAVALLLLLDFVWLYILGFGGRFLAMAQGLGVVARPAWHLGLVGVGAYALLSWGLCAFALIPAMGAARPRLTACLKGALLGLVVYGVYDLTNLVVFGSSYGVGLAATDVGWGVFVMGSAALGGAMAAGF